MIYAIVENGYHKFHYCNNIQDLPTEVSLEVISVDGPIERMKLIEHWYNQGINDALERFENDQY